jgi:hypothetical protein
LKDRSPWIYVYANVIYSNPHYRILFSRSVFFLQIIHFHAEAQRRGGAEKRMD